MMPASYVSLDPDTLEIVDRFVGTQEDVDQRSAKLEHVVVPPPYDHRFVVPHRDANTGFITFTPDLAAYEADQAAHREAQWSRVRAARDAKLKETDWIVAVPDAPFTDTQKTAWIEYRQALRYFPSTITDVPEPENVIWPAPPS